MELSTKDSTSIDKLIKDWIDRPEQKFELETTFGVRGTVDATTFLNIAQRLRGKGYEPLPQDDRLSIFTKTAFVSKESRGDAKSPIRFSLFGLGILENYCKDDSLEGKPFQAMIKDGRDNVDLTEYDVRIKMRREIELSQEDPRVKELTDNWDKLKKAYRLIRRWSFMGNGMRFDLSIVRSTPKTETGDFKWSNRFQEYNILKSQPIYEVEVELMHSEGETYDSAKKILIKGIGDVLRAIQKNTILIRNSVKERVLTEYKQLAKTDRFRGVNPVTLTKQNMVSDIEPKIPNIRTGYNVTDKADGLRCMGFCDKKGELYMIDMSLNVYRTGLQNNACAESLVDGEWVTADKDKEPMNAFLLFDIYIAPGKEVVSKLPFMDPDKPEEPGRWKELKAWITKWTEGSKIVLKSVTELNKLQVLMKEFIIASPKNPKAIFGACDDILSKSFKYYTDGLIITDNLQPIPEKSGVRFKYQFKWKPSKDNTIDFLINFEKDADLPTVDKLTVSEHPITKETVIYKTMRLYVGTSSQPMFDDPRSTILDELPIVNPDKQTTRVYRPGLFVPDNYPDSMANTSYVKVSTDRESGEKIVMTEETDEHPGEPIVDRCIVEMKYDPAQSPGWRWIPLRVRHDKTERLRRAEAVAEREIAKLRSSGPDVRKANKVQINFQGTMNNEEVANDTWDSIYDPITPSMIRTGNEEPTKAEIEAIMRIKESDIAKTYYERTEGEEKLMEVRGMRNFHNRYIKDVILYRSALLDGKTENPGGKSIIDFAVGRAGDLNIWRRNKAGFVFGVDIAGDNILNEKDGAYRRYLNTIVKFGKESVPPAIFSIGSSAKNITTGEAGATEQEADIMRSVIGRAMVVGSVPKFVNTFGANRLNKGADVGVCMFAIHYFFENIDMLDGFIKNLSETIKVGGYFIGTTFDGQTVFNKLRGKEKGESATGMLDEKILWTIRKEYDADELLDDDTSVGLPIDVEFITIGAMIREYLVSFEYLKRRLKEIGLELLNKEELAQIGLKYSTNTFDVSFAMMKELKKSEYNFDLPEVVREFSFMNRWFIFKRRGLMGVEEDETAVSLKPRVDSEAEVMAEVAEAKEEEGERKEEPMDVGFRLPPPDAVFTGAEIYRVGPDVAVDTLRIMTDLVNEATGKEIKKEGAARWLAIRAPFPIRDFDADVQYPSVEAYLAGMMVKYAGKSPEKAKNIFSSGGDIHQRAEDIRRAKAKGKTGKLTDKDYYDILEQESKMVRTALLKRSLDAYKIVIDEALWNSMKDTHLKEALTQRWERDAIFRKIVEDARVKGKYILYSSESSASEFGGVAERVGDKYKIGGDNKVGKIIMELASFRF